MIAVLFIVSAIPSHAQTLTTLHSFCSQPNCTDGEIPYAGLVQASDGNLYGAAQHGGSGSDLSPCGYGCGTLFKITPSGVFTTLYSFCALEECPDGALPSSNLLQATDGNLYGSTLAGGLGYQGGYGTIFKITLDGMLTTLYTFCTQQHCTDGKGPNGLVQGSDGNFYGTTVNGGAYGPSEGAGTVFRITPAGVLTPLYNFCPGYPNCSDGNYPTSGLVQGSDDNFYGETGYGGPNNGGTIFKITPNGALTTISTFPRNAFPEGGLVQGTDGNFYGVTTSGGLYGDGTVFQVTPSGVLTTLHTFGTQQGDGAQPVGGLIQATDGVFYGTTSGTIFKIISTGTLTTLYTFCAQNQSCSDGSGPIGALVQATSGALYGTTAYGGSNGNAGTVFSLSGPSPTPVQFVAVTPCRLVDTRQGNPIEGGTWQTFMVPQLGGCNIPSAAAAYSLSVTVVPHGPLGYLTIWPAGRNQPLVSTMNSQDGRAKANAAIVPAGASGAVSVYVTDTSDVILDIDGYFTAPSQQTLQFYPLTPCRVVDTRAGSNQPRGLGPPFLGNMETRDLPIPSSTCLQGLPNQPQAYSLNVTAVPYPAGQPENYVTVWPSDQPQPAVSTLNNYTATVVANAAIVPAAANGNIKVFAYNSTDVIMDINGYFAAPGSGGYSFYPAAPCRAYDSRNNNGQPFSGERTVNIVGSPCAPPASAQAYVFNATVVPTNGPMGYLTLWPDSETQPVVSTLNAYDGYITSNMAMVPNANGSIDAYAAGLTQLILDISGYFAP